MFSTQRARKEPKAPDVSPDTAKLQMALADLITVLYGSKDVTWTDLCRIEQYEKLCGPYEDKNWEIA